MRKYFAIAIAALLAAPIGGQALASEMLCSCQQVTICGADECEPAPIETCPSTDIGLSLAEPAIKLCVFSDCLEGSAQRTDISETVVALEGHYSPTQTPDMAPTHVLAVLDRDTNIGFVQSSDEQAVVQYTLICTGQE